MAENASGLVLTGNTITLGAGTTQLIDNDTAKTLTIASALDGSGDLNKVGAGTLTLSGSKYLYRYYNGFCWYAGR